MGLLSFFYPWGIILQLFAVVHFIRRRPDNSWLFVIFFFGPPGALVYLLVEVLPDFSLLRQSFDSYGRKKKIRLLEALVRENPSPGNYEELAECYLDEKKFEKARGCYDKVLSRPGDNVDAHYRRAIAALHLDDELIHRLLRFSRISANASRFSICENLRNLWIFLRLSDQRRFSGQGIRGSLWHRD